MNKFEKNIKDAVESYEAPYSAEAWQSLNKAMGPSKATLLKWVGSSAAIIALAIFGYTYFNTNEVEIKEELIAETVQNKESKEFIKKIEDSVYDTEGKLINDTNSSDDSDLKLITDNNTPNDTNIEDPNVIDSSTETKSNPKDIISAGPNDVSTTNENKTDITKTTPEFKAKVIALKTRQCLSNEFHFTPSVPKQNAIYEWHLGDGTILTASTVNHTYELAGNYLVELILRDQSTKEILKTSPSLEITVLEEPNTSFTYENGTTTEPITYFNNTTSDKNTLHWEIENLNSSNLENFEFSFKHKGRFTVNLTATNENGCSTTSTQYINIEQDYNLFAPNAFSPDGDNLNDNFMPKALPLLNQPFTLTIYDRQGKLVYQTSDSSQPWDGINMQDGKPASNGIYVWACQLTNENGETEIYQSQVVITK